MAFKCVFTLNVAADLDNADPDNPPRVNHSNVDFDALLQVLKDLFRHGPHVEMQVANDTIDQVSLRMAALKGLTDDQAVLEQFGEALLTVAKKEKGPIVNVRSAWAGLHFLKDRDFAPPPVAIPIVWTGADFEDSLLWHANTRPSIGLAPSSMLKETGRLPVKTRSQLAEIFGCKFIAPARVSRVFFRLPARARQKKVGF